jgi:hypothetical protein
MSAAAAAAVPAATAAAAAAVVLATTSVACCQGGHFHTDEGAAPPGGAKKPEKRGSAVALPRAVGEATGAISFVDHDPEHYEELLSRRAQAACRSFRDEGLLPQGVRCEIHPSAPTRYRLRCGFGVCRLLAVYLLSSAANEHCRMAENSVDIHR